MLTKPSRNCIILICMKQLVIGLVLCLTAACVSNQPVSLPDSVHWFRDSAEQKAVYVETYRAATESARKLSAGLAPRSWGVILDVDETILDNSDYQKRLAEIGERFDPKTWNEWVQSRQSTALPGARAFLDAVLDDLSGQVVLVTNRPQDQCAATEDNLRGQQLRYDRILCDRAGGGDKNPRFRAVVKGEPGVPPVNVLIWVGDNIQDFPSFTQASTDFAQFGLRYFALPNPLYGSWQSNPAR